MESRECTELTIELVQIGGWEQNLRDETFLFEDKGFHSQQITDTSHSQN